MDEINEIAKIPSTGDEVLRRYRYQYLYTILLTIQMYNDEIEFKKLFCELADDILGVLKTDKLASIQIKTSESKPAFSYNDIEVTKSIGRFIHLNQLFPNVFEKFIFVANIGFKKNLDLNKVIKLIKENPKNLESKIDKYIKKLGKDNSVTSKNVIDVLSKIQILKGPSIDDIESKITTEYLSKLDKCKTLSVPRLSSLLNIFELEISRKSAKVIKNSIKDYIVFVKEGEKKQLEKEIESKLIVPELVKQIVENAQIVYLVSNQPAEFQLKLGSTELMEQKMAAGGIGLMEIESMKNLSFSAHTHFFEEHNRRNGESEEISREIDHLQVLLGNEAAESETEVKNDIALYGTNMLRVLEKRIKDISESNPKDVFGIKYGILKGIIGILTGDCKIWFNDERMTN